ncbi:MAG: hypothetical protein A2Y93_00415 [Chloroflexi bacterium RBG_13_68_17]|nr:MAG: hypothetical protein A2Y93_00415 [Chloroflexi bacterium RBG_13_68_17]
MDEFVRLPLNTADGRPLVHKYRCHSGQAAGLLAIFPGNLYGVDGPLLFYPGVRLWEQGWDTLAITYGFQTGAGEGRGEAIAQAFAEAETALRWVLGRAAYPRIALLGKSLGASVVAHLCGAMPELHAARAVYLTPPVGTPAFDGLFAQTVQPSHIVQGTADAFYDGPGLESLRAARPFSQTLIPGGDHSLVLAGDLDGSIEALRCACSDVVAFLQQEG